MKHTVRLAATALLTSILAACGSPANTDTANQPANTAAEASTAPAASAAAAPAETSIATTDRTQLKL